VISTARPEEILGELLRRKKLTLSAAESCTGGRVGDKITNVSGSSDYFLGGAVTYSNEAKAELLKVKEKSLKAHGAVSEQVAKEMALGCRKLFGSDIAVSTTGIAGPTGGSKEKPVARLVRSERRKEDDDRQKGLLRRQGAGERGRLHACHRTCSEPHRERLDPMEKERLNRLLGI